MKRFGLFALCLLTSTALIAATDAGAPLWAVIGVLPMLASLSIAGYYSRD